MKKPVPVTIVSGFLGAGKTTLLCDLLRHRQERRLAVLINELGEVSIDGALTRASMNGVEDVEIVDFPSGLIAYAEDEQFVPTLKAIARRAGQVDHVLIETSGVALPTAAMARLQTPELADDFVLDATLVVVDTPRLLAGQFDGAGTNKGADCAVRATAAAATDAGRQANVDVWASVKRLFDEQLAAADVVVLNKIDELDGDALLVAEEHVRKRAPKVRFLELARDARLDVRVALGLRLHQVPAADRLKHFRGPFTAMPGAESRTLADHGRVDGHSHSGLAAHLHGLTTHSHFHEQDPGWLSFTLRSGEQQSVTALRTALEQVAEAEPLLRCKGFALGLDSKSPMLLQGVRTRVVATEATPQSQPKGSELVFIGYHLSRARVASMLSRLTGTAWS